MVDITYNGITMEYDVVESMMDVEIRMAIASIMTEVSEQEFLDVYMQVHQQKYGKAFLQG